MNLLFCESKKSCLVELFVFFFGFMKTHEKAFKIFKTSNLGSSLVNVFSTAYLTLELSVMANFLRTCYASYHN